MKCLMCRFQVMMVLSALILVEREIDVPPDSTVDCEVPEEVDVF
jgi:hypothetical protein